MPDGYRGAQKLKQLCAARYGGLRGAGRTFFIAMGICYTMKLSQDGNYRRVRQLFARHTSGLRQSPFALYLKSAFIKGLCLRRRFSPPLFSPAPRPRPLFIPPSFTTGFVCWGGGKLGGESLYVCTRKKASGDVHTDIFPFSSPLSFARATLCGLITTRFLRGGAKTFILYNNNFRILSQLLHRKLST
jgi:hypothetical protein